MQGAFIGQLARFACLALLLAAVTCTAALTADRGVGVTGFVRLIVSYCPSDFSNKGAIVDVDPVTGAWKIVTKFAFPSQVFGCTADYSPSYSIDPKNPDTLWFDFTSDAGYFVAVDLRHGNTTTVKSGGLFFTGFVDFAEFPATNTLRGITGTVTQGGYCSDGCIGFGVQDLKGNGYQQKTALPFKETADDARYIDVSANKMYFQAGYDLRETPCAPVAYEQCMLVVDTNTGALLHSYYSPHQFQVFKYGRAVNDRGVINAFLVGFNSFCGAPANGSATVFGTVDLNSGTATPQACVPQSVTIDTDQWVASYSIDERILATASGNGEGDPPQFITFNTTTGAPIANTQLNGLAKALDADMGLVFVWGVEFTW